MNDGEMLSEWHHSVHTRRIGAAASLPRAWMDAGRRSIAAAAPRARDVTAARTPRARRAPPLAQPAIGGRQQDNIRTGICK